MIRYSLLFVGLLAVAEGVQAQSKAEGMFDELSRDFGSVPRGQVVSHPFRIVNNTKQPVRIRDPRVSCHVCSSARILKNVLQPGEETAIIVTMDSNRFINTKTITVFVNFDQPRGEEVRLWVQANSRQDVSVSPDALAFGQVKRASAPSSTVTVTFLGNTDWKITGVASDSNYVRPRLKELKREDGEVAYQLTAALRADTPVGRWYTDIWLRTNNPATPRVRVPLTVEIESALSISPASVLLGQVQMGQQVERKVIVRGVKPFKVTGVQGTDSQLTVQDSTADSKPVHVLTVTLKAARAGDYSRTVRVLTDLQEEGEIDFLTQALVVE